MPLVHRYGRRLVSWRPEGTTALIAGLCAASAEAEGGKPPRNSSNQKGSAAAKYADFLPLFAHRPESLMLFCEFALHSVRSLCTCSLRIPLVFNPSNDKVLRGSQFQR